MPGIILLNTGYYANSSIIEDGVKGLAKWCIDSCLQYARWLGESFRPAPATNGTCAEERVKATACYDTPRLQTRTHGNMKYCTLPDEGK